MPVHLRSPAAVYKAAALGWVVLAGVATAAGIVRETLLVPRIGELRAHQLGTLSVCGLFLVVIAAFVRRTKPTKPEALIVGLCWLAVAIAFEFGFGHYADGLPWSRLLSDYDLSRGRVLLLLWATVALGPLALRRILASS